MLRLVRAEGRNQDLVLPGVVLGAAHWLGWIPSDTDQVLIAAGPSFVIERVGLRTRADLFAECALKRPAGAVAAAIAMMRGDERRYRDILRRACAVTPLSDYAAWRAARLRPPAQVAQAPDYRIRVVVRAAPDEETLLAQTVESLAAQTHVAWRLTILSDAHASVPGGPLSDERIDVATIQGGRPVAPAALLGEADALGVLAPGDVLAPDALAILARRLAAPDAPDLVYADEETVFRGLLTPRLKPDWSPDLALATGYVGRLALFSRALCARLGDRASDEWFIAATLAAQSAAHVPRILGRTQADDDEGGDRAARLNRLLAQSDSPARAEKVGTGALDLSWPLPEPAPLASVVIPSRDRPELIGRIVDDVLTETDYPAIELVVVDNGSSDPAVLRLYERLRFDPRVRIEVFPHPFDFAAMVNAGAAAARGSVLVFLNNDIAVIEPSWLSALVAQAVRPEVGAVGAKLLYGDGRLQHAGVVVGLGGRSGHIFRRQAGDTPGRLGQLKVAHEVSAVTAACLAVERRKFDQVSGFDAKTFPIDFNDADLCLRLAAAGWTTMWTPRASLHHLESVSRGLPSGAARARFEREADAFTERWRSVVRHDPYYHPALTLTAFTEALE